MNSPKSAGELAKWNRHLTYGTLSPVAQLFIDVAHEVAKPLTKRK
jgi:hypothetical protein